MSKKLTLTKAQTKALGNFADDMAKRVASLNSNPAIRAALIARITRAASNPKITVMALHQVAQLLETIE